MNEYIPIGIERDLGVIDREDGLIGYWPPGEYDI